MQLRSLVLQIPFVFFNKIDIYNGLITLSKRVLGTIASCPKIEATKSLSLINTQLSVDQVVIPCERTQKNELFYPINSYFKDHSEFRRFFKVIVSQMNRGNAKF